MALGEDNQMKPKVVVILGPTATGKSNCGIKFAMRLKSEILSGDSMLVYRGNRYSVPTRFIGSYLGIRIINNQVYIYMITQI